MQSVLITVNFLITFPFFLANNRWDRSRTPILSAALDSNRLRQTGVSNAELVEYLMDNGANITAVDDKGSIHIYMTSDILWAFLTYVP